MALIRVRAKDAVNGDKLETEVDEAWLARWPDDFERIDGEPVAKPSPTLVRSDPPTGPLYTSGFNR